MKRPYAPVILLAVAIDWLLGEPPNARHPVAWFGRLIHALERRAPNGNPRAELFYGAGIAASGIAAAVLPALAFEHFFSRRGWLGIIAGAALLKSTFAWRALIRAGENVRRDLEAEQLDAAQHDLRSLVSRDASRLDSSHVAAAAIESLAENASDSFIAPLFYYNLFGLVGACVYRAVNTMDAMVGYHGRHEFLGKVSARLDDILNFIPARLTALLIVAAARFEDPDRSWKILRRDHMLTTSPNAGYPMSAMAGALNVCLEKVGHYRLNRIGRAPRADDIRRAARIVTLALGLATALSVLMTRSSTEPNEF